MSQSDSQEPHAAFDPAGRKVGLLWLTPGTTLADFWSSLYAVLISMVLLTIVSAGTNYVLTTNFKGIVDPSDYGKVNGLLAFATEVVQILVFGVVGMMADRMGRRPVFVFGLLAMCLSYVLYPLATSITELTVYRVIYALGIAAMTGMLGTVLHDYAQESSRGKMVGVIGVLNGIGVVGLNIVFSVLVGQGEAMGLDPYENGLFVHWVMAALCVLTAIVVAFGLRPGVMVEEHDKPEWRELARAGFAQARNPRIALSYSAAFIARSDLVILGTFTVAWGTVAGNAAGLSEAETSRQALSIFITAQTAALIWAPFAGIIMDLLNRVTGAALLFLIAAIGYMGTYFVGDALAPESKAIFALLGVGQISAFFAATVLIGQEAPERERGAVVGMFNVVGAIGILISTSVGSFIFDAISPNALFVTIGVVNAIIFVYAVIVRATAPGHIPQGLGRMLARMRGTSQVGNP